MPIPNPLRRLTFDGEYMASVLGKIDGPVVLVRRSYGGAAITPTEPHVMGVRDG